MSASRREFLALSTLSLLGAPLSAKILRLSDTAPPGARRLRHGSSDWPRGSAPTSRRRKLVNFSLTGERARPGCQQLAHLHGGLLRAQVGHAQGRYRTLGSTWSQWKPGCPVTPAGPEAERFVRRLGEPGPLPGSDEAIAFSPVQSAGALDRAARAYLRAADRHLPGAAAALRRQLRCVITLTPELAPGAGPRG